LNPRPLGYELAGRRLSRPGPAQPFRDAQPSGSWPLTASHQARRVPACLYYTCYYTADAVTWAPCSPPASQVMADRLAR